MKRNIVGKVASVLFGGMVFLFSACSNDVQTIKSAGFDIGSRYDTYAWLPAGDTTFNQFNKDMSVAEEVRNEINNDLQNKGYQLDPKNPDFLVLVHTKYDQEVEWNTVPAGYSYYTPGFYSGSYYGGYYTGYNSIGAVGAGYAEPVQYTEGTVVIDIIDAQTHDIVWRGRTTEDIYVNSSGEQLVKAMASAADEIIEEFPEDRLNRRP